MAVSGYPSIKRFISLILIGLLMQPYFVNANQIYTDSKLGREDEIFGAVIDLPIRMTPVSYNNASAACVALVANTFGTKENGDLTTDEVINYAANWLIRDSESGDKCLPVYPPLSPDECGILLRMIGVPICEFGIADGQFIEKIRAYQEAHFPVILFCTNDKFLETAVIVTLWERRDEAIYLSVFDPAAGVESEYEIEVLEGLGKQYRLTSDNWSGYLLIERATAVAPISNCPTHNWGDVQVETVSGKVTPATIPDQDIFRPAAPFLDHNAMAIYTEVTDDIGFAVVKNKEDIKILGSRLSQDISTSIPVIPIRNGRWLGPESYDDAFDIIDRISMVYYASTDEGGKPLTQLGGNIEDNVMTFLNSCGMQMTRLWQNSSRKDKCKLALMYSLALARTEQYKESKEFLVRYSENVIKEIVAEIAAEPYAGEGFLLKSLFSSKATGRLMTYARKTARPLLGAKGSDVFKFSIVNHWRHIGKWLGNGKSLKITPRGDVIAGGLSISIDVAMKAWIKIEEFAGWPEFAQKMLTDCRSHVTDKELVQAIDEVLHDLKVNTPNWKIAIDNWINSGQFWEDLAAKSLLTMGSTVAYYATATLALKTGASTFLAGGIYWGPLIVIALGSAALGVLYDENKGTSDFLEAADGCIYACNALEKSIWPDLYNEAKKQNPKASILDSYKSSIILHAYLAMGTYWCTINAYSFVEDRPTLIAGWVNGNELLKSWGRMYKTMMGELGPKITTFAEPPILINCLLFWEKSAAQQCLIKPVDLSKFYPKIEYHMPREGQEDVPLSQIINVKFNTRMRESSINTESCKLHLKDDLIPAQVTYYPASQMAYIDCPVKLKRNKQYQVTIADDVMSRPGLNMEKDYVWIFKTRGDIRKENMDNLMLMEGSYMWSRVYDGTISGARAMFSITRGNMVNGFTAAYLQSKNKDSYLQFADVYAGMWVAKEVEMEIMNRNHVGGWYLFGGAKYNHLNDKAFRQWHDAGDNEYYEATGEFNKEIVVPEVGIGTVYISNSTLFHSTVHLIPYPWGEWAYEVQSYAAFGIAPYADLTMSFFLYDHVYFSTAGIGIGLQLGI